MKHFIKISVVIIVVLHSTGSLPSGPYLVVNTSKGPVRGTNLTSSRSNRPFYAFMGIPYAAPPIGNLRFKAPEPAKPWRQTINASLEGQICPQVDSSGYFQGNEDCLFVNVFTPQLPSESKRALNPVMVWIHGGKFLRGSGNRNATGPDYFMGHDVVLVTFNYRLGILGFLSLHNEEVPGNSGLKDQVMLLKWVKENIDKFGGDPKRVTIFGEGTGASCVHYHMLSPMSEGLFHQAISQSGTPLHSWGVKSYNSTLKMAFSLGEALGANTTDAQELLNTLRLAKPRKLVAYLNKTVVPLITGEKIGPTIDVKAAEGEVFLPDTPIQLTKDGKMRNMPYIIGVNNAEGLMYINAMERLKWLLEPVDQHFQTIIPVFVGKNISAVQNMSLAIKEKYFNTSEHLLQQYADVVTDFLFVNQVYCIARKMVTESNSSVYAYLYSFDGTSDVFKKEFGGNGYTGACHGDELPYLFRMDAVNATIHPYTPEFATSSRLIKLWTNFAKTGNPTPESDPLLQNVTWTPIAVSHFPYLDIHEDLEVKNDTFGGHPTWWEDLYHKYVPDISPCW